MKSLQRLADVDIVRICQLQQWYLPGYWPLTWPGQVRCGRQGLHEVIKQCTAYGVTSTKRLKQLMDVFGEIVLPKNIMLIHENGDKSFIREDLLTPNHQFTHQDQGDTFLVQANANVSVPSSVADAPPP